ncbi:hypothetical protein [Psittacicella hinzii]|uniref:hypothetical protein n=1 Tax=Psittacicella hinzii TaxID=2028575 RepID=UPI0011C34C02|nr:hypothetical protein [Psittacicella hinzii]
MTQAEYFEDRELDTQQKVKDLTTKFADLYYKKDYEQAQALVNFDVKSFTKLYTEQALENARAILALQGLKVVAK